MKYLQGKRGYNIALREKELPKPDGNMVLVKTLACGVCGSDIHILERMEEYTPMGHEISAVVTEVGACVTKVQPGDHVIVEDVTMCGTCEACKNGKTHLCRNMYTLEGQSGMGEYLCVHENMLNRYEGIDDIAACVTEPLAVCLNTFFAAQLPPEGKLVVMGNGILGIMTAALAKYYGAMRVVCVGSRPQGKRSAARSAAAKELGADAVFYASEPDYTGKIKEYLGGGADAVIVTSPPRTIPDAMQLAAYGANIVNIGLDFGEGAVVPVNIDDLVFNKNNIISVFAEPARMFPLSTDLIRRRVIDVEKLVTHRVKIEDTDTLKEIFMQDSPVIKAVIEFHSDLT